MAIKLYNKSKCPDKILQSLITAAGRRIRARTSIVVKVLGPCQGHQGYARPTWAVNTWHLMKRRIKGDGRSIITDCGWIELHIPHHLPAWNQDPLIMAEKFYRLCLHEWAHIKDFQDGKRFGDYGRNWRNRPHEMRAMAMQQDAEEIPMSRTAEGAILDMAIWLEQQTKKEIRK